MILSVMIFVWNGFRYQRGSSGFISFYGFEGLKSNGQSNFRRNSTDMK